MSKKVLITGSSSGFGKLIAQTLIKKGHSVVASMRDPQGKNRNAAEELKKIGAHIVDIDVTSEKSVTEGVREAVKLAGGIDVVINNAGAGTIGLQEEYTPEDWKKLFDINVFGVQRINRAVLPHMRSKNSGLLVHISSLLGKFVLPFMGPYNSSKHALEALAENYRVELSGLGIDSVIVEPGGFGTGFITNVLPSSDNKRTIEYGEFANAPMKMMQPFEENLKGPNGPNPQMVA
ncbi:MAG TPA: SDR family oxidoreductase, partial [candidate division Zixibacteria bacterium]|nr:SDR family oxidoreductase [candidate division Zixibacteria bacterium]